MLGSIERTSSGVAFYRHIDDAGARNREVVLLVHGLGSSAASWKPLLRHCAQRANILALDLPGFGATPTRGSDVINGAADAIVEVIEEVSPSDSVRVVAHSVGGVATMVAASRSGRMRELTLISGALVHATTVYSSPSNILRQAPLAGLVSLNILAGVVPVTRRQARHVARSTLLRRLLLWPFVSNPTAPSDDALVEILAHAGGIGAATAIWHSRSVNVLEVMAHVQVPVRLVHGDHDRLISAGDVATAASVLGSTDTVTIANAGHWPHIERPHATASAARLTDVHS